MKTLFLYGPPASGKTTLGERLATATRSRFCDLDAEIVRRDGRDVATIFDECGEDHFRELESATLADVVSRGEATVVSLGGGTLLRDANRRLCEAHGTVLCLDAPDASELRRRLNLASGCRPLGDQAAKRAAHYATFTHRIAANFDAAGSCVLVGTRLAASFLDGLPFVADVTVDALYREEFGPACATLPSGEAHKTPATVMRLWQAFARAGLGRHDCIAALGGGVTGDLTGFAAATWMRGIDWVNFPTSLLAMVDASTGGKTGCDLPEGKNLAGAFHLPRLVVVDTDFLRTLSAERLADGRAEMIKHEIVGGLPHDRPPTGLPTAGEIAANLRVKVDIVRADPYERTGRRILLNCGHTIGHAVEKLSGYALSHGAAVAIGCVAEARLAVRLGLAPAQWPAEIATRLAAAGLPTEVPHDMDRETLTAIMRGDKKREGGCVTFALPCGWGDVRATPIDLTGGLP